MTAGKHDNHTNLVGGRLPRRSCAPTARWKENLIHLRRESRTVLLIIILGVSTGAACVPVPGSGDVTAGNPIGSTPEPGETILAMTREPALGWCPDENMLLSATVTRGNDGHYYLTGTRAIETTDPSAECLFGERTRSESCLIPEDIGFTILSNDESSRLIQMLQDLVNSGGIWAEGHGDPICFLTVLSFGEYRAYSNRIDRNGSVEYRQLFTDIEALLDAIASNE